MVRGIDKFKEYFGEFNEQYVFIGGAACDIILGKKAVDFRATKDLDIVLLVEAVDERFMSTFIEFIKIGGYSHIHKGTGEEQFYRFEKPEDKNFPYMIELFSKKPDYIKTLETNLAPIHISDDAISLSAILLNDEYYALLKEGAIVVDAVTVLNLEYIILFKIKAWLDLKQRKVNGEAIDSKNIRKHKNDIFRLALNIEQDTFVHVSAEIKNDVQEFVNEIIKEPETLKNIGATSVTIKDVVDIIVKCYGMV